MPESETVCERNSSETVRVPDCTPPDFGANATCITQAACPLRVLPQLFTTEKSPLAT